MAIKLKLPQIVSYLLFVLFLIFIYFCQPRSLTEIRNIFCNGDLTKVGVKQSQLHRLHKGPQTHRTTDGGGLSRSPVHIHKKILGGAQIVTEQRARMVFRWAGRLPSKTFQNNTSVIIRHLWLVDSVQPIKLWNERKSEGFCAIFPMWKKILSNIALNHIAFQKFKRYNVDQLQITSWWILKTNMLTNLVILICQISGEASKQSQKSHQPVLFWTIKQSAAMNMTRSVE